MSGARGFTLVELIIALSLTAMIAAFAYGGLHLGMRGWDRAGQMASSSDEARVAWTFIRARLSQARPVARVEQDESRIQFEGHADRVRFVAPAPAQQGAGLYVYALRVEEDSLWLDYGLYLPDLDAPSAEPPRRLIQGLDGRPVFSYFGAARPDDDPRWHDGWDRHDRLPERVRVELRVAGEAWPAWIIPIRAGGGG